MAEIFLHIWMYTVFPPYMDTSSLLYHYHNTTITLSKVRIRGSVSTEIRRRKDGEERNVLWKTRTKREIYLQKIRFEPFLFSFFRIFALE